MQHDELYNCLKCGALTDAPFCERCEADMELVAIITVEAWAASEGTPRKAHREQRQERR